MPTAPLNQRKNTLKSPEKMHNTPQDAEAENPQEDVCAIQVDGVELVRGPINWTYDLFEHITGQPGTAGYDLPEIEKRIGRPFTPMPNQKVEYVNATGGLLISARVPKPDPSLPEYYWPLPKASDPVGE